MPTLALIFIAIALGSRSCSCAWPGPNTAVIAASGALRGTWGQVLCGGSGSDLADGQFLVCWDVWAPGQRTMRGWVEGHEVAGNCTLNPALSCSSHSSLYGTSLELIQDLINPDDLNISFNGTVFR